MAWRRGIWELSRGAMTEGHLDPRGTAGRIPWGPYPRQLGGLREVTVPAWGLQTDICMANDISKVRGP